MKFTFNDRTEIAKDYKWNLESLYENEELLEKDMKEFESGLSELREYKGKLMDSAETLYSYLTRKDELEMMLTKMHTYISNRFNENNRDSKYQALEGRLEGLYSKYSQAVSFENPELLKYTKADFEKFFNEEKELKIYEKYLDDILKFKPHTLSEKEENMMSTLSPVFNSSEKSFSMLTVADMGFPSVNINGKDVEITQGNFVPLLENETRDIKEEVYKKFYGEFEKHINTLASTLEGTVKSNVTVARLRNFDTAREAALFNNAIPISVYDKLTETVINNLPALHEYMSIRKKALGLDKMYMYDIYSNLVNDVDLSFTFEEGRDLVLEALKPLGEEYIANLKKGFEDRWCDVYETPGKRGGAYSSGGYGTMPFVLLNFHGTLDNVFTIAHEMGHSMHTFNSCKNQPYVYSGYSIFVAEVASTMNESMLTYYLLKKWTDKNLRKYVINHFLDTIKGTLFRQTQFAIFEDMIYKEFENNGSLTADFLNEEYGKLNEKFYGPEMEKDEIIKYEWSRIPHFYYNFYVYQYATGISAALSFAKRIMEGGEKERDLYLQFLKSGSSMDPIDVLKRAGVDMNSPQPIEDAIQMFKEFLEEFKTLI
ncbi:oligoendopeptidase F [Ezakiella coagulans]|uniref:oligoendopeptidase F n=1 Tax=Ezakiella coagulans TaxID=46507 RepID=UPI002014DBCF|nr:oligoendopeptidase F [Ezakiella coagulans]UQK60591.1 oligoendopeptidase F [Ezakiella coagulans]